MIAYANRIKQDLLQVPSELLEREGAVSAAVGNGDAERFRFRNVQTQVALLKARSGLQDHQ